MGRLTWFRGTIAWGLIYVIALSSVLTPVAYAPDDTAPGLPPVSNIPTPLAEFSQILNNAEETTPPPVLNLDLEASQYHRVYVPNPQDGGATDIFAREVSLTSLDLTIPVPDVAIFDNEVHAQYDKARREFAFVRTEKHTYDVVGADGVAIKKTRVRVTDAHVYKNVDITSNIIQDPNFYMFATPQGVRAIFRKDISKHFCGAPVIAPVAISPSMDGLGEEMTHIEFLQRSSEPRWLMNQPSYIDGGDIAVTFSFPDGVHTVETVVGRAEVIMILRMRVLGALARMVVANPDPELSGEVAKFLSENMEDLARYQAQQEALLKSSGTNDLQDHALRTLSQREDIRSMLSLFKKDGAGQDAFQRLAADKRDRFSADPSADGEWRKDFLAIQEKQGLAKDAGTPVPHWKDVLRDKFVDADGALVRANAVTEGNYLGRMINRTMDFWNTWATSRNLTILGAVVAGVAVNYAYDGVPIRWSMATLTQMLDYTTRIPVVSTVTGPIYKNLGYFADGWRVARWVAGVGVVSTFYFVSLYGSKMAAVLRQRPEWKGLRAFFNYGVNLYGYMCYPVQKVAYDVLRQKNLYAAMDAGVNPMKTKEAWNAPWASEAKIHENAVKLGKIKESEATMRTRSMMIAAAVVSKTSENGGNPIDMATLIMAGQGTQIATLSQMPLHEQSRWTELTMSIYSSLQDLGAGPIDEKLIAEYHQIFSKHVEKIQYEQEHNAEYGYKLKTAVRKSWDSVCSQFSHNILPFVMFGKQGYDRYRVFRRMELSDNTVKIATEQYAKDYLISAGLYGASAAKKFGDIITLGPNAWEVLTNQMSQVFIYGIQGAIDPMSGEIIDPLSNPYRPLSDQLYADGRNREQTTMEALKMLVGKMTDPADQNPLTNHAKVMENTLNGLQVRLAADYLTRSLGMYLTPTKPGAVALSPGGAMVTSMPLAVYFLLAKISVSPNAVGYMVIWPYVQLAMRHLEEGPQQNLLKVQAADYFIDTGIRLKNRQMVNDGIRVLQELYKEGKVEVPSRFAIEPEKFTDEQAVRFHEYSMEKVPLPTRRSNRAMDFVNIGLGVTISNLFFDAASSIAYESQEPWMLAAKAVGWFGATYVGLKLAAPVYEATNKAIRYGIEKATSFCNYVTGRAAPEVAGP